MTIGDQQERAQTPQLEEHAADITVDNVLVPTDGGPAGEGALRWVAHRSKMHRLDVEVLTAAEADRFPGGRTAESFRREAQEVAERTARHLGTLAPSARIRSRVVEGDARERFAEASASADMIVVGSNRVSTLADILGETFSVKLAEAARCPAIVVPRDWAPKRGPVVLGVAGDSSDDAAAAFAVREAKVLHSALRMVHAWQLPALIDVQPVPGEPSPGHAQLLQRAIADTELQNPGLRIEGSLVEGRAAQVLLAESERAQLLVVGSHGHDRIDRFFLGSVSRAILLHPRGVVALIRPQAGAA